jgi:hypothetical protein
MMSNKAVIAPLKEICDRKPEDISNALLTVQRTVWLEILML